MVNVDLFVVEIQMGGAWSRLRVLNPCVDLTKRGDATWLPPTSPVQYGSATSEGCACNTLLIGAKW